jgi:UPF0755 protein
MHRLRALVAFVQAAVRRRSLRERTVVWSVCGVVALVVVAYVVQGLRSVVPPPAGHEVALRIPPGSGVRDIADALAARGVLRSPIVFQLAAFLRGDARALQAGDYVFRTDDTVVGILDALTRGAMSEVSVVIPEGATFYEIDELLAERGVVERGSFVAYVMLNERSLEGRLFPDTYRFFTGTGPQAVAEKLLATFAAKAEPMLERSGDAERDLLLASLLEREVPEYEDRRVVAGILKKRVSAGMPLQVDATICYLKEIIAGRAVDCLPLTALDFEQQSPYNTYLQRGWPPGPIGNPGLSAIQAALRPVSSSYWYYLSDPATQRTIFSTTFDEHRANKLRYLRP